MIDKLPEKMGIRERAPDRSRFMVRSSCQATPGIALRRNEKKRKNELTAAFSDPPPITPAPDPMPATMKKRM
ncbi:MAG: hypothetical protein N3G18_02870 [Candidatus Saccharicenans sp.]|nr:hypothetical protein [Candidatus Saccharicenans sp.]